MMTDMRQKFFDAMAITYKLKQKIKFNANAISKTKKTKPKSIELVTNSPETTITVDDTVKYSGQTRTRNPKNCSGVVMKVCNVSLKINPDNGVSEETGRCS